MANVETSRKTLPVYDARKFSPDKDQIVARLVGPESEVFGKQPVVIYKREEVR